MLILFMHIGSALSIWLASCIVFLRKRRHGFWACFLFGWALQVALSLPAGIWQALQGWPHIDVSGSSLWARCLTPLVGWPFNTGGYIVRRVFEATVGPMEPLVGHRSATVLSNMPYYAFLMAVQASIIAAVFAFRYGRRKTLIDSVPICLGLLFLINSFANVRWFWAGT